MDNPINKLITKQEIEKLLNYFGNIGNNDTFLTINNIEYYQLAFVHESYYMSIVKNVLHKSDTNINNIYLNWVPKNSNERLEYLGDHILKAIMGKYLYKRFGQEREGFLTRLKIKIERCSSLHKIAMELGFKKWLLLSLQVENETILDVDRGRNTPSYYEDAFEAFIGAIVEDFDEYGYIYAERFVINVIENIIDFSELISNNDNFKDSIQRFFQSQKVMCTGVEQGIVWKNPIYIQVYEFTSLYNQKIFIKCVLLSNDQLLHLEKNYSREVCEKIKDYTTNVVKYYKHNNPIVFEKLMQLITQEENNMYYILGIAQNKKVINTEQDVAKMCLINLNLDLDY
jgi:dsRNA-specific ribonuclease